MPVLTLISRKGCHLCDHAALALDQAGVAYEVIDVDSDAELQRLYDFRVPVLLDPRGAVVAEGKITSDVVGRVDARLRAGG